MSRAMDQYRVLRDLLTRVPANELVDSRENGAKHQQTGLRVT